MRLTENNIRFVKEYTVDGITYGWYVCMKSNKVSDGRNYSAHGFELYPVDKLPKTVQNFIQKHSWEIWNYYEDHEHEFTTYIYKD